MTAPLRAWFRAPARRTRPFRRTPALRCEPLEDRTTPAFWTNNLVANGTASFSGSQVELTHAVPTAVTAYSGYQAGSVFAASPADVTRFHTRFAFQATPGYLNRAADGLTFTIQGVGPNALGGNAGLLGYGPSGSLGGLGNPAIPNSVAVKFDCYNNAGEGTSSTGLYLNGAAPGQPSTNLLRSGIDLASGRPFQVDVAYAGSASPSPSWTPSPAGPPPRPTPWTSRPRSEAPRPTSASPAGPGTIPPPRPSRRGTSSTGTPCPARSPGPAAAAPWRGATRPTGT